MIRIMCKGRFIPVFKRCPSDLKMLQWHFSGSFVHTCQGKCDGRWEMAAAAVASASTESSNTTTTLLEFITHQPDIHTPTALSSERPKKEFGFTLTGFISYSVHSNIIHWDEGVTGHWAVIFIRFAGRGNQRENNGILITDLHELIYHRS